MKESRGSSSILGQAANRWLFTCEYIKSWLCKHRVSNPIYTSVRLYRYSRRRKEWKCYEEWRPSV